MKARQALPRILVALVLVGIAVGLAFTRGTFDPAEIKDGIHNLGPWGPIAFVAISALAAVFFVPGAIVGLTGGALFGPWWGTAANLAGATLGATLAFLLSRYLVSGWVRQKAGARVESLIAGVETEGWRFVAFVRLVPLFPFNLLNYALGLTRIPLTHYVVASLVCMLPGTLAFTWLGHAGREALDGDASSIRFGLIALALLATVSFVPRFIRRFRQTNSTRWMEAAEFSAEFNRRNNQITVLDVRGPDEFIGALGHIAGARNVPHSDVERRLPEFQSLKHEPVVLVCHTDKRSSLAASILVRNGFSNVRVLRGGMTGWTKLGHSVVERHATGELSRI